MHLVWFACPGKPSPAVVATYEQALAPLGEVALVWITPAGFSKVFRTEALQHKRGGRILPGLLTAYPAPGRAVPRSVGLIAFSAGYGLAAELLASQEDREALDGLVLLDGLHAGYDPDGTAEDRKLDPFVAYGRRAMQERCAFAFGHTDVRTYRQYASTTESADELLRLLDLGLGVVEPNEAEGYTQRARRGGLVIRSYDLFPPPRDKAEHGAALTAWGPKLVAEELVPWLQAFSVARPPRDGLRAGGTAPGTPAALKPPVSPVDPVLKRGSFGPRVGHWQEMMNRGDKPVAWTNAAGLYREWPTEWAWPLKVDDDFGDKTVAATECWQSRRGLKADGIVGPASWAKADEERGDKAPVVEAPRVPAVEHGGAPLQPLGVAGRERVFGKFTFRARSDGSIDYLDDWPAKNVVRVAVPQLERVPGVELNGKRVGAGPAGGLVHCHRLMTEPLQRLFAAWEDAGLLDRVLVWSGLWSPRMVRGSATTLSSHAHASAFDINAPWNGLGQKPSSGYGSVADLVSLARKHGFFWGGDFSRPDGMHFELVRP